MNALKVSSYIQIMPVDFKDSKNDDTYMILQNGFRHIDTAVLYGETTVTSALAVNL